MEGRNTGIPTAIKSIKENGSPLPLLLTDEERSFFSVIIPIHEAFLKKEAVSSKTEPKDIVAVPKRRTKDQIKTLILNELELEKQHSAEAEARRSQIGTGDRSEKIRTYNFPQGRVTDHRIKLTLHKLDSIMNGDLDEVIDSLIAADQAAKLASMNEAV